MFVYRTCYGVEWDESTIIYFVIPAHQQKNVKTENGESIGEKLKSLEYSDGFNGPLQCFKE